ncbi:RNase P/MRP, p29 subunit [Russula earlei]|uniref:RNase P/MRP, p29 subunit n=1 Tax=Russula earlei TaxID=71964 RepID=A0ACC0UAJ6_9AGAM|nr:RNase P/MRP, p29 subunit [Russula earlei]
MSRAARQGPRTSANPFTPEFVKGHLVAGNNRSQVRAQALYDERVRRRQLVLAERRGSQARGELPGAGARRKRMEGEADRARARAKGEKMKMGRREAAEKGVWRLRKEEARWDAFVPLHRLWLGYMSELLGLAADPGEGSSVEAAMPHAADVHPRLVKADFHGSIMTALKVRKSKNPGLVRLSGIVVQETENTFKVVTKGDKLKVIPKQGSIFVFAVPLYSTGSSVVGATPADGAGTGSGEVGQGWTVLDGPHVEIELYGNQFCFRAADRAGRKFKHKETIELF